MKTIDTLTSPGMFRTSILNTTPEQVDRQANIIHGASLMQVGDLNDGDSRPWTVTHDTLQQVVEFGSRSRNGLKARFTHPNMSSDGMGSYLIEAVARREFFAVQTIVALVAILFVLANTIVDLLYTVVDPRVRATVGS